MPKVTLTPTQQRIFQVLCDGQPHNPDDLICCLWDSEQGARINVQNHVSDLRKILREYGEDILTQYVVGVIHWRLVRLVKKSSLPVKFSDVT